MVAAVEIEGLQDADPRLFRTRGLRGLAREVCRVVRDHSAAACAVNATGGYKAQIAVAVLIGQALGVPVYYKHERFDEVIAFPPLPVALDFEVWARLSGVLFTLEDSSAPVPADDLGIDLDDRCESLVERVTIDGTEYVELSATGQIFHETFRERFRSHRRELLPPPAGPGRKRKPVLKSNEAHLLKDRDAVERFLNAVTGEVPAVVGCVVKYYNPDLPSPVRFRLAADGVEGVFSDGNWAVKFRVETTAESDSQRAAVVVELNEWLAARR